MKNKSGILYNEGFWTIPGVIYQGKTQDYNIFENLTPAMNQKQLAEFYEREKPKGNPYPANTHLFWANVSRAYDLREENPEYSEGLRKFLQFNLQQCPNTISVAIYNPEEEDEAKHNYRTSDEYSLSGNIVGLNREIVNADAKTLKMFLGTGNITQINNVSQWINQTPFVIWRLKEKPPKKSEGVGYNGDCSSAPLGPYTFSFGGKKDERIVRFGAYSYGLSLDCCRYLLNKCPAFRVLGMK